ncbi:hypothetical protein GCM10023086_74900 [Streptomyces venetus]|uniref:ATP-dependent DNA ligase family profile domain-containing protein n=1 Tax=Streptomyces venetus TaxID=1701086 RepID=A0ABP8HI96_9ACTN
MHVLTRPRYRRDHWPTREFPSTQGRDSANRRASAFDLLRLEGTDTTRWTYRQRREALAALFAEHQLTAPWALCPSTTDPDTVHEWLTHFPVAGLEGVVFKRLDSRYEPVRGWLKYKIRETEEAVVGAVTGSRAMPRTLLLGRYDVAGHLHYTGRSTTLPQAAGRSLGELLTPADPGHPWTGWTFSAVWGSHETLHVTLVQPELVVEVGVDVTRDSAGRWRHPARWHRPRLDLAPADTPRWTGTTG